MDLYPTQPSQLIPQQSLSSCPVHLAIINNLNLVRAPIQSPTLLPRDNTPIGAIHTLAHYRTLSILQRPPPGSLCRIVMLSNSLATLPAQRYAMSRFSHYVFL